jgi:hypothetical protein
MADSIPVEELLARHRVALDEYHRWDSRIAQLLKGRRARNLNPEELAAYREAVERRDAAYDEMSRLERMLLDNDSS